MSVSVTSIMLPFGVGAAPALNHPVEHRLGFVLSGALTEWIGPHVIFGAFLLGVVAREGTGAPRGSVVEGVRQGNSELLPVAITGEFGGALAVAVQPDARAGIRGTGAARSLSATAGGRGTPRG